MKNIRFMMMTLSLLGATIAGAQAQKKVAIISFYLDREVDFSLMQSFNDDSEDQMKKLMEDPDFQIIPLFDDFHDFVIADILPQAPFELIPEAAVTSSPAYNAFSANINEEGSKLHAPYDGYLALGEDFDKTFIPLVSELSADGLMMVNLTFFVRKNGLKTVIMAQIQAELRNSEGKNAWKYIEFGLSQEGITTFSGFIVSNQDEVMPMFISAVDDLKRKMKDNFSKRAANSTKKL